MNIPSYPIENRFRLEALGQVPQPSQPVYYNYPNTSFPLQLTPERYNNSIPPYDHQSAMPEHGYRTKLDPDHAQSLHAYSDPSVYQISATRPALRDHPLHVNLAPSAVDASSHVFHQGEHGSTVARTPSKHHHLPSDSCAYVEGNYWLQPLSHATTFDPTPVPYTSPANVRVFHSPLPTQYYGEGEATLTANIIAQADLFENMMRSQSRHLDSNTFGAQKAPIYTGEWDCNSGFCNHVWPKSPVYTPTYLQEEIGHDVCQMGITQPLSDCARSNVDRHKRVRDWVRSIANVRFENMAGGDEPEDEEDDEVDDEEGEEEDMDVSEYDENEDGRDEDCHDLLPAIPIPTRNIPLIVPQPSYPPYLRYMVADR